MTLLADVIQRGTRAAQPAANTVAAGTIYYVTDEEVTERSTGAAWQDYSDAGTPPTFIAPRVSSAASSATPTPDADTTDVFILTALAEAAAFAAPSGTPVQGQPLLIRIKDDGTARALSFNAIYRALGVTLPTTTVIGKTMYLGLFYNSTDTKWDVVSVVEEA